MGIQHQKHSLDTTKSRSSPAPNAKQWTQKKVEKKEIKPVKLVSHEETSPAVDEYQAHSRDYTIHQRM